MHRAIWLLAGIFFISGGLMAQGQVRGTCGTTDVEYLVNRVKQHQEWLQSAPLVLRSSVDKYVPVTIIFVADDNGNGYARPEQALEALDVLNRQYAPQDLIFYIDEFRYKADTDIYDTPASASAVFQMKTVRDGNALNIFVTRSAQNGGNTPGTILGYYDSQNDWIVIRKDEFNAFSATLSHEVGHFFGLPHPHSGWECDPYDEETHGNPVNSIWSPCNSGLRVEYQDGSNCSNAGDMICDTPPDYNFGFGWSVSGDQCAPYDRETMDPKGDVVDPMEENIMGYFIDCDEYVFTPNQMSIVQSDFFSSSRSYLRTGVVPVLDTVLNNVVYNFPINDEESPTFTQVEFDWDDTPGANAYLFIIDRFSTFTQSPERYLVEQSGLIIDELDVNKRYYWKVWPYNESHTGAGWGSTQQFVTGVASAVNTISSVEEFDIFPNPVSSGNVTISLRSSRTLNAELRVVDLSGQIIRSERNHVINAGITWQNHIDVTGLVPSLYLVQLVTDRGIITEKISVQ